MPWLIPIASAVIGGVQTISANSKRRHAEADLEKMAKDQQPNASILDYYNKALAKYNPNPFQTVSYQQQNNQVQRNLATGLNAASNRRMGLGALGAQVQQANDASARAVGNAEIQQGQDLARLGQAGAMKTAEQQKKFDMMYNLKAMKAGQAASTQNTGMQNVFNGLSSAASIIGSDEDGWSSIFGDKASRLNNRISRMDRTTAYTPSLNSYR